jgi:flavin reductase (DIM6/NTAB) family NADH-FMN oxidoreductase RutF
MIESSREFVVSFPGEDLKSVVEYFGSHSGREFDKFKETDLTTRKSKFLRVPLIEEAVINLECFLDKTLEVGDHIIFFGKIVASYHKPPKKLLFFFKERKEKYSLL